MPCSRYPSQSLLGTLRSDDGNGNENVKKKPNRFNNKKKNNYDMKIV